MSTKTRSLLLGLTAILCWASLATFGNLLIHLPPFFVLGVTFLLGCLPALLKPRLMFPPWRVLVWGVLGYFGYHFFLFYAFRFAPAVEANLINYLWPVIMVLISPLAFPEQKLRAYHLLGAILSVIGCVVLVSAKGADLKLENLLGYALAFAAAITWPVYSIGKKKLPPTSVWAIGSFCLVSGVLCLATHVLIEPRVVPSPRDLGLLFLMGLGPFGLAFYCWDLAMSSGDSRLMGALAYLTPVLSTLSLVLVAGQVITFPTMVAMVLIIGGASTGLLDLRKPVERSPEP